MLKKYIILFGLFLVFSFSPKLKAEFVLGKETKTNSIFDEMYQHDILKINLIYSVAEVNADRKSELDYPATLNFKDKSGKLQFWDVKIKIRGRFRRLNCEAMPPLKMTFDKADLKKAGLDKYDDYKLVTPCIENEAYSDMLILKEYLAYKYYNILTYESFRVQLLEINFIDSKTGIIRKQLGFIIEDLALLRKRIGATKVENTFGIQRSSLNIKQYQLMSFFQYMIGNTDWNLAQSRNLKAVEKDGKLLMIPYDFDFSGLVLAPYARINLDVENPQLRGRIYQGFIEDLKDMEHVERIFKKKKRKILRLTRRQELLQDAFKRDAMNFIKAFYSRIKVVNVLRTKADALKEEVEEDSYEENKL